MKIKNYIQLFLLTSFISTPIACTTQHSEPTNPTHPQLTAQEETTLRRIRNQSFTRPDRKKRLNQTPEQDKQKKWYTHLLHLKSKSSTN